MPTFCVLAGQRMLALLHESLGHGGDALDRAVDPDRRVDAMRQQVAGDAGARRGGVEPPGAGAALGHVGRDGPVLQEARAIVEDLAEPSLVDDLLDERHRRDAPVIVPDDVGDPGLLDRRHHRLRLFCRAGERLLRQHHLAGFGRRDGDLRMRVVRRADVDGVDVLARHQLAPVGLDALVAPIVGEGLAPCPGRAPPPPSAPAGSRCRRNSRPCARHSNGRGP